MLFDGERWGAPRIWRFVQFYRCVERQIFKHDATGYMAFEGVVDKKQIYTDSLCSLTDLLLTIVLREADARTHVPVVEKTKKQKKTRWTALYSLTSVASI